MSNITYEYIRRNKDIQTYINYADEALSILRASGEEPYIIGEIVSSAEKIEIC